METTYYTFIYCMFHDDGCIIEGNHQCIPAGYCMAHSDRCDYGNWYIMGVIACTETSTAETDIKVVYRVRINYNPYNGLFPFIGYKNSLTNVLGEALVMPEYLSNWIVANDANSENCLYIE